MICYSNDFTSYLSEIQLWKTILNKGSSVLKWCILKFKSLTNFMNNNNQKKTRDIECFDGLLLKNKFQWKLHFFMKIILDVT